MGHVDAGKCVSEDTRIFLGDGQIKRIDELYTEFKKDSKILADFDGHALELKKDLFVLGEEKGQIKPMKISHIWKLKKTGLLDVKLRNGAEIKTTPEHPFPVLNGNFEIEYKKSENLKKGNFVIIPRKTMDTGLGIQKIKSLFLEKLSGNESFIVFVSGNLNEKIKESETQETVSFDLYHAVKNKRFRLNELLEIAKKNSIPLDVIYDNIEFLKQSSKKQRAGHTSKKICLPKTEEQFKDFLYVAGMILGDGSARTCELNNNDEFLLNKYKQFFEETICVESKIIQGRTCQIAYQYGWRSFALLVETLFDLPLKRKSQNISVSGFVQMLPNSLISEFVSGYFDTDGTVLRNAIIEVTSASKEMIEIMQYCLLRFGINSKTFTKKEYYYLSVIGKRNTQLFKEKIGFKLQRKQEKIGSKTSTSRVTDLTPISGEMIKDLRLDLGFNATELKIPYFKNYETYENLSVKFIKTFIKRVEEKLGQNYEDQLGKKIQVLENLNGKKTYKEIYSLKIFKHRKLLNLFRFFESEKMIKKELGKFRITLQGKRLLKEWKSDGKQKAVQKIKNIKEIIYSDLSFCSIAEIKSIENDEEFVYDLTQPKTHNFVANGLLIHNTRFLDRIRGTSVIAKEAGGITQHIGATEVPLHTIEKISGNLLAKYGFKLSIPGLLFIDTPGHEAFANLRERGGSIADLAVLVVDINKGLQEQTKESIEILKNFKVPFVVVANKLDTLFEWNPQPDSSITDSMKKQSESGKAKLDDKLYQLVGQLFEKGFNTERFDRVDDMTKQIPIIPISAKTGEGFPEVLMFLAGLSQKYLEDKLAVHVKGPGKGTILEVKETKGMGKTIDVILYDGKISAGDRIALGGKNGVIETKVRALLLPKPLDEMRDPEKKFGQVKEVTAASGVKVVAPNLNNALAGSPMIVVEKDEDVEKLKEEINALKIESQEIGPILKTDTLGSLEAIASMLEKMDLKVRRADVGDVTRRDLVEAESINQKDRYKGVLFAFNVNVPEDLEKDANEKKVKIFKGNIIYALVDDYEAWQKQEKEAEKKAALKDIIYPAEFKVLPGNVFRNCKPAIVGVKVLRGKIKTDVNVMNKQGKQVGSIRAIQSEGKNVQEAIKGQEVAISIDDATIGKNLNEKDVLFSIVPDKHAMVLKKFEKELDSDEIDLLEQIQKMKK